MDENETNESGSSDVVSLAAGVAKDLAVTVAGTVIGLGLLQGSLTVFNKIQARCLNKTIPAPTEN